MAKTFRQQLDEDGRHVRNLGVLSLLCSGVAYARTIGGETIWYTDLLFLGGIFFGMIALYHGRRTPTRFARAYSAGYVISLVTVSCGILGLVLNLLFTGHVLP